MREPWIDSEVLVIDDDVGWQRAVCRILYDLDLRVIHCMRTWAEIEGANMTKFARPIVLTELSYDGQALGGLTIVDAARRLGIPAAVVTNADPWQLDHLRAVPFLQKVNVSRATLGALLRTLDGTRRSAGPPTE